MKYDFLSESPVRQVLCGLHSEELSIFESTEFSHGGQMRHVRNIVKDIETVLLCLEQNRNNMLKIAVLGEVKAGKSTFVNACAGKEVAYVDVLEATSVVSEITYAKQEYVKIIDKNNNVALQCGFEELLNIMEEKVGETQFFENLSRVEIGVNNPRLRNLILLDTPGLLSITTENQHITSQYIYQADYIFWVLNSRNLGDKTVNDKIKELNLQGKPITAIVNKVDDNETRLEIEEYIYTTYGNIFDEIFYISSRKAWRAVEKHDEQALQSSGIGDILEFLDELSEDAISFKQSSNEATQYYQLLREKDLHTKVLVDIETKKRGYDSDRSAFRQINTKIKHAIGEELQRWSKNDVYMIEKTNMLNATGAELLAYFNQYSDANYIGGVMNEKYQELVKLIYKEWSNVEKQWLIQPSELFIDFDYKGNTSAILTENTSDIVAQKQNEHLIKGVKTNISIAATLAGYSAWLGPAASSITFGSALLYWGLPIAIGSVVISSMLYRGDVTQIEASARAKNEEIERLCEAAVKTIQYKCKDICLQLEACTEYYCTALSDSMMEKVKNLNFSFEEPEYSEFINSMHAYIKGLSSKLEACDKNKPAELQEEDYLRTMTQ